MESSFITNWWIFSMQPAIIQGNEGKRSARYEQQRMQSQAKETAKLLHHFTRFLAHRDSWKIEEKMEVGVSERISEGVKFCGELKLVDEFSEAIVKNSLGAIKNAFDELRESVLD
jgi:hypothetical protein